MSQPTLASSGVAHLIVDDLSAEQLSEQDSHHFVAVRRLRSGDRVTLGDGKGSWRVAILHANARGKSRDHLVSLELIGQIRTEMRQNPPIIVGFCLPSLDRASWAIQKMTELGVDGVHLLHSEYSSVRQAGFERGGGDLLKLERVAREAGMQSRAAFLPVIEPICDLAAFARLYPGSAMCTLGGDHIPELGLPIIVGPEGGFSQAEMTLFPLKLDLGRNVLRSETAAVAVSAFLALKRTAMS